jgi:hypothetical protein
LLGFGFGLALLTGLLGAGIVSTGFDEHFTQSLQHSIKTVLSSLTSEIESNLFSHLRLNFTTGSSLLSTLAVLGDCPREEWGDARESDKKEERESPGDVLA